MLLDVVGPFGFADISEDLALKLTDRLKSFESRTWNEIFTGDKKNNHSNKIANLCQEAKRRLRQLELDDADELRSLRLGGKHRLYGFLRAGTFYILWLDRDHLIYPSKKKHT